MISVHIPGPPVAQGRPRTRVLERNGRHFAVHYDPTQSRNWKATAQAHMLAARGAGRRPFAGPVAVEIVALFELARSHWRKRDPVAETWSQQKPDIENVVKAVLDAGTGVLYLDDRQVARLVATKRIAAQGAAPGVWVRVEPLDEPLQIPLAHTDV